MLGVEKINNHQDLLKELNIYKIVTKKIKTLPNGIHSGKVLAASHSESVLGNCDLGFYHFKVCMLLRVPTESPFSLPSPNPAFHTQKIASPPL